MGFTSLDDFTNKVTNLGQFARADWNKVTGSAAYTAGRWYDLSMVDGTPPVSEHGNILLNSHFSGGSANWSGLGSGGWAFTLGTNLITHTAGTAGAVSQAPIIALIPGVTYTIVWTLSGYSGSGNFTASIGGTSGTGRAANGTYTETIVAGSGSTIDITAASTAGGSIDDVMCFPGITSAPRFVPYTDINRHGGIWHGGNVTPATKHLLNIGAMTSAATGVPSTLLLVDILGAYPRLDANSTTSVTLNNAEALPRYADGAGVRAFVSAANTIGATAHNITINYTNSAGVAGRNPGAVVAATPSAIAGHISHSGTAANNYGPFLPLAAGDAGIRSVQNFQLSAASGTSGSLYNLVLCKPLAMLPITTVSVMAERDLMNQLPSLPQIKDGAYLAWVYYAGAATAASTSFIGSIDFAWG